MKAADMLQMDILVRNMVSNLEIDEQKRVIFEIESPFIFIFVSSFSTGYPVGERNLDLYEPICKTIDYIILNPTWRPTYVLVESNTINKSSDFSY